MYTHALEKLNQRTQTAKTRRASAMAARRRTEPTRRLEPNSWTIEASPHA